MPTFGTERFSITLPSGSFVFGGWQHMASENPLCKCGSRIASRRQAGERWRCSNGHFTKTVHTDAEPKA